MRNKVGITERGDGGLHLNEWLPKHNKSNILFSVIITKAPSILLKNFKKLPKNIIIHATITGLGGSIYEMNVNKYVDEIKAYQELVNRLDGNRVVLRIDPINPLYVDKALEVASYCLGRLRISILDFYPHVRQRLSTVHVDELLKLDTIYRGNVHAPIYVIKSIVNKFPKHTELCGELSYQQVGCISEYDFKALNIPTNKMNMFPMHMQRKLCNCICHKTELLTYRNPCKHNCLYCYWKSK